MANLTENTKESIDTTGIKNKNTISYLHKETKYKITIQEDKVLLLRENNNFSHKLLFDLNKITKTEYYIKEYNTSIDISVKTTKIKITENNIEINYNIIDSSDNYCYKVEMSDKI